MNLNEWLHKNAGKFDSDYENIFVKNVFPLIEYLNLDSVESQYPFKDAYRNQRYCDFVIKEGSDIRIAIEIDGYDKRGTGNGMSHDEFIDWQRRQSSLTSQGWYVLRFANRDVMNNPQSCAEHINILLKRSRNNAHDKKLSIEDKNQFDLLSKAKFNTINHLKKEKSIMKYTVTSFTVVVLFLIILIAWKNKDDSIFSPVLATHTSVTKSTENTNSNIFNSPRQKSMHKPPTERINYDYVMTAEGISCNIDNDVGDDIQLPMLDGSSHFFCPCTTDLGCALANPHLDESGPKNFDPANTPKGASCDNPINWHEAQNNIGKTFVVSGPFKKITQYNNVRGNPSWIDIGETFPNKNRLNLIIWGNDISKFSMIIPDIIKSKNICVVGKITSYKGVAQMEINNEKQLFIK